MADFEDFDSVFAFKPDYAYDRQYSEAISGRRRSLDNQLFFDRLLTVSHVKNGSKLYPPRSNQELRALHQKIVSSVAIDHYKQSLLFYILLDCRKFDNPAESFARDCSLPDKYQATIQGLWFMDHLQFQAALEHLTLPSLIPTFPDEILHALVQHAPGKDLSWALAYYYTVSPPLSSPKSVEALFVAMCGAGVTDAFFFARGQAELLHRRLLELLITSVLSHERGEERGLRGMELVNLPFDELEERWFEEFLTTGNGKSLNGAKDSFTMRRIATGRFSEVIQDRKGPSGRKREGVNWDTLKAGLVNGMGHRQDIKPFPRV